MKTPVGAQDLRLNLFKQKPVQTALNQ